MNTVKSLAQQIGEMSSGYETSPAVQEELRKKNFIAIIGPFAVGKSSIMDKVCEIDKEFGRVRSFTTRPMRAGESEDLYEFLPHDQQTLELLLARANDQDLVQVTQHAQTGYVYGSTIESYRGSHAMLDALPSSIEGLMSLPFKKHTLIGVATPPDVWLERSQERLTASTTEDFRKRLIEGVANIEWCLEQGDKVQWVVNGQRKLADVALECINISKGDQPGDPEGPRVAEALRDTLKRIAKS